MLRVGLTGGIACGKSTVLRMLQDLGAATISADSIVHELLDSDTSIRERIRREFGEGVFDETGRVDRRKLADIAFRDDSARMKLEHILHPEVRRRILVWMDGARSRGRASRWRRFLCFSRRGWKGTSTAPWPLLRNTASS